MRVTKAIREYVEEEINKKYYEKIDRIGNEYREEKEEITNKVKEIMFEAGKRAEELIRSSGFDVCYSYHSDCLFRIDGQIQKDDVEKINRQERELLRDKCKAKIKQVLFDLEMGETAKAELKDVLDNLVID